MWRFTQANRRASAIGPEQPLLLPLPVALLDRFALVVLLLAPSQGELDLGPAAPVEIDRERHERQALALHRPLQLGDLAVLKQQFARPPRLVVESVAVAIFGNVAVDQPHFLAFDRGVAFGDRPLA